MMKKTKTLRDLLREKQMTLESQREQLDKEFLQLKFMETVLEQTMIGMEAKGSPSPTEVSTKYGFAFKRHWGHSEEELAAKMESLRVKCQGNNSRAVMRSLIDLDKEGFVDISDVKAAELYDELCKSFGMPNIKKDTFSEAYRVMG